MPSFRFSGPSSASQIEKNPGNSLPDPCLLPKRSCRDLSGGVSIGQLKFALILFAVGVVALHWARRQAARPRRTKFTPKSRVAGFQPGPVEAEGFAWPGGIPVTTLRDSHAVYYTIRLQQAVIRGNGSARQTEWVNCWSRSYRSPFYLVDASGVVRLIPDGAEIEIATRRETPWARISKNDRDHFIADMLDQEVPEFPPPMTLKDRLTGGNFRVVEEEISVGAPLQVLGEFRPARGTPAAPPPGLRQFAALVFDPSTRSARDNKTLLKTNKDAGDEETRTGSIVVAKRALRLADQPEPAAFQHLKIVGDLVATKETHFLIVDRQDVGGAPNESLRRIQTIGGSAAIVVALLWMIAIVSPWAAQRQSEMQQQSIAVARANADTNKPTPQEIRRANWRRQMARLDRQAFGLRAEEIPSTSFEINDPVDGTPMPLALKYGVFLIEPKELRVIRYDDDLRGVGETPGLLHVSQDGQIVVQDMNRRLVVLDLTSRTRTPYPFQAAAAIIEAGELYWVRVENQLARVYRTRIKDFETVELATNLSFPEGSTAEFIRVSEKIHLVTRATSGQVVGKFEILLNELSAQESPQLNGALAESDERLKAGCPDCDSKNEPITARLTAVGQLNVVYEIYTKRIFWIGNQKKSRLISSAGPPNEERLQGTDCLRQPQRCLTLDASDRLEYFGNYGREYWAAQSRSLHYLCMAAGGRACEAMLFALDGKNVSAAVKEQYLWASCRTANAFSCQELIRRNVPYKGWAEFAMGNFTSFEQRLPANSVEGVDMVEPDPQKESP